MNKFLPYLTSTFFGCTCIASITGISNELFNAQYLSAIFSTCFASLLSCITSLLYQVNRSARVSLLDLFILSFLVSYWIDMDNIHSIYNIGYMCLILFYCVMRYIPKIQYNILYWCCIISSSILSIWGYLQLAGILPSPNPNFPVTGPFYHPAYYGLTLSAYLCIIFHILIFHLRNQSLKKIYCPIDFSCFIIGIPALYFSESRTACTALIISITFTYVIQHTHKHSWKRKRNLFLTSTVFFILLIIAAYFLKPVSADGRLLIWKVSCEMIKDNPITGHGKGGFEASYLYYQADYLAEKGSDKEKYIAGNIHVAYNEAIRIAVEHGIPGLIIYTAFIFMIAKTKYRNTLCVLTSQSILLLIFIQGLFSFPHIIFPVMLLGVIALAILSRSVCHLQKYVEVPQRYSRIIVLILVMPLSFLTYKKFLKYHAIYNDIQHIDNMKSYSNFTQYLPDLKEDNIFLTFYLGLMTREKNYTEQLKYISILEKKYPTPSLMILKGDILRKKSLWNEAEEMYKSAAYMVPSSQQARGRLVFLYKEMGKYEEAYRLACELLTEQVKDYGFETFELHQKFKKEFPDIK